MLVATFLNGIAISNFRGVVEPLKVPLQQKITFLVGQNNSGKSSILRFFGLLLNSGDPQTEDQSTFNNNAPEVEFLIKTTALVDFAKGFSNLSDYILKNSPEQLSIKRHLKPSSPLRFDSNIFNFVREGYFSEHSRPFLSDFGQAGSIISNTTTFLNRFWKTLAFPQTVFVPSQRMILLNGHNLPHFGQTEFPGNKILMSSIVDDLARLDRPSGTPTERKEAETKLSNICGFIEYCLEVEKVEIKVPEGKQTIYLKIDGNEQPISNLGSGIEQLIVIGLGSFVFPSHIVLIDEPENHFHPRTQKRMMQFLDRNADAKFLVATHSAAIIDSVDADIIQIHQQDQKCTGTMISGSKDRYNAVRNLGHSPSELVLANFVIWVEGPSDRVYINHFIKKLDASLVEGVDYAIIFYGGSVLASHEFDESDRDFVKALSISRNFAVYMDSDKKSDTDELKARVARVSTEVEANNGVAWVSNCREIENYIPNAVLSTMKAFECDNATQYGRVVKAEKFDKVKFAEKVTEIWGDEWPFDLRERCTELIERIRQAR